MDNTHLFDRKSKIYNEARPKYAEALLIYLNKRFNPDNKKMVVADIGAGTGIFTAQLLQLGWLVYAVEPNQDMRHFAEQQLGKAANFRSVAAQAENTTLPDHSVDLVTAAQAFHWFEPVKFRQECRRILKPNGYVVIVYNSRFRDANTAKLIAILKKYCPRFHGFSNNLKEKDFESFFGHKYETIKFKNTQHYSHEKYVGRVLSSSYALTKNDANYAEFVQALNDLAEQIDEAGTIKMPLVTTAYIGQAQSEN